MTTPTTPVFPVKATTIRFGSTALLLTLLFLTLRINGLIDWGWVAICAPLWIGPAAVLAILALCIAIAVVTVVLAGVVMLVLGAIERRTERQHRAARYAAQVEWEAKVQREQEAYIRNWHVSQQGAN